MFSSVFYHDFPDQKYPLLVGVMRSFERNTDGIATPQYEFRILLNVDILMGTRLKLDVDNLLIELNHFKKTCHEIEKNPVSIPSMFLSKNRDDTMHFSYSVSSKKVVFLGKLLLQ